jgi:DNA-binding GntR family transcriptional regulator
MNRTPDGEMVRDQYAVVLAQTAETPLEELAAAEHRAGMIEAIAALDGAATAMSAPALTPDDLIEAERLHGEISQLAVTGGVSRLADLCDRLHATLSSRCPNARLRQLVDEELTLLHAVGVGPTRTAEDWWLVVCQHADLLTLARRCADVEAFTQLLRSHRHLCH